MKQIKYYYDEAINKIKLKKLKLETIVKNMKFPFLILFSIYLIGYSSIIRANFAYIDDLGRINAGYRGWENWSRFTSNFLSSIIHTIRYLDDISPLTQLIAIVFLTLAGLIVLRFFTNREKFTFTEYAAASIMGFFPFFLECISYKFDAPYMALSILASVFPIVFLKNKILYFITTILSTLVVCTTYQAANGIFPILVILCAINFWNQKDSIRDIIRFIYISCGGYIIGLLIFKVFIMVPVDSYVSNSIRSEERRVGKEC